MLDLRLHKGALQGRLRFKLKGRRFLLFFRIEVFLQDKCRGLGTYKKMRRVRLR
jgi:hypothetical protein